jgi:hypothetical protein
MVVDQARQDTATLQVDEPGLRPRQRHNLFLASDVRESPVLDRDGARRRIRPIKRREHAAMQNDVRLLVLGHCRSFNC